MTREVFVKIRVRADASRSLLIAFIGYFRLLAHRKLPWHRYLVCR